MSRTTTECSTITTWELTNESKRLEQSHRVAPEIRRPAEDLVVMLATESVRLGGAPKPARAAEPTKKLPD